ncbi:MAG: pyridoxamine 5'-phosphate oxidase family protein [Deltaproteobacteria bacterium]|nr:pyridoxamine 5'-phosphate oxidase family protein [Deltaproteobacteria bacterium]
MELKDYFANVKGTGILASADAQGKVDAAIYSRPHFMEDGTLAFIMADRLTHHNLQSNPYAVYLFMEEGPGYKGQRLFLKKTAEEQDTDRLYELRRRKYPTRDEAGASRFLVFFEVEKVLPLVGAGREEDTL